MSKDGRPRTTPNLSNVIMCGGNPTPDDLAKVQEFAAALAQPTDHLMNVALVEQMAEGGDEECADALKRHAEHCRYPECQP